MRTSAWGGSEDLWYKAAKLALRQGHTVYSLTQQWEPVPNQITQLRELGATTRFYYDQSTSLPARLGRRFKILANSPIVVPRIEADVYVISNGSTWDFIHVRQVAEQFINLGKPYLLISQHGFENGNIVRPANRGYALEVIARATAFFFVARRNLEAAERQLAGVIDKAIIISNPLNTTERGLRPYPPSSTLRMACVARLMCEFKGQDILLQALSQPQWRSRDFRLRLYGMGPDHAYLQTLIDFYELRDKISLEGHVHDADAIWQENQVLVLPSLNEGTPLALMEAMMAGRAALVTDVGDSGRYVVAGSGSTGILIDTASVKCVGAGLEELWNSRNQLEAMGRNAFHHAAAITDFHPDATLLQFIESLAP